MRSLGSTEGGTLLDDRFREAPKLNVLLAGAGEELNTCRETWSSASSFPSAAPQPCCSGISACCSAWTARGSWCVAPLGHDQRKGTLPRIFAATAVICWAVFSFWFLVILGPNDPDL